MNSPGSLPTDGLLQSPSVEALPALHRLPSIAWAISSAPVALMPIESIVDSRNGHGEIGNLDGFTASIQARGLLQPLIVTPEGRLLAGRRRLEAARRAGLTVVPVRVCEVSDERAAIEISLVENVERADLDPLTRAHSYRGLIEQGATVEEIAALVGQGIGHVYQHLALLDLHPAVQEALHSNSMRFADARALAPLELEEQAAVLREIRQSPKPLSSRQVKARVEARRVMRLVHDGATLARCAPRGQRITDAPSAAPPQQQGDAGGLQGNYALLFETEDAVRNIITTETQSSPLEELNAIIAEMVAAAQGEDQLRTWGRRLSHILEILSDSRRIQQLKLEKAERQQDAPGSVQGQLL